MEERLHNAAELLNKLRGGPDTLSDTYKAQLYQGHLLEVIALAKMMKG